MHSFDQLLARNIPFYVLPTCPSVCVQYFYTTQDNIHTVCLRKHHLCVFITLSYRYYAADFKFSEHAVSIRQKPALMRKSRYWGDARLAVEGWSHYVWCGVCHLIEDYTLCHTDPLIPKSNLGKSSASKHGRLYKHAATPNKMLCVFASKYRGRSYAQND